MQKNAHILSVPLYNFWQTELSQGTNTHSKKQNITKFSEVINILWIIYFWHLVKIKILNIQISLHWS